LTNILETTKSDVKKAEVVSELDNLKMDLDRLMEDKIQGTILRSKVRWYEQGERNTKYFYSLEKRNASRKHITKLQISKDKITENPDEILAEQKRYYQKLYQSVLSNPCISSVK